MQLIKIIIERKHSCALVPIMKIETFDKLKKEKALTDSESREVIDYIRKCESEIHELQTKLQHYEDLAEQGRLVELKCVNGDVV